MSQAGIKLLASFPGLSREGRHVCVCVSLCACMLPACLPACLPAYQLLGYVLLAQIPGSPHDVLHHTSTAVMRYEEPIDTSVSKIRREYGPTRAHPHACNNVHYTTTQNTHPGTRMVHKYGARVTKGVLHSSPRGEL